MCAGGIEDLGPPTAATLLSPGGVVRPKGKINTYDLKNINCCFHDALLCRIPYGAAVCYLSDSRHHLTEGKQAILTSPPSADTY